MTIALDLEHETFIINVTSLSSVASPSYSLFKEFAATALDLEYKTFIIQAMSLSFIALLSSSPFNVHPFCRLQIADLIAKEAFTKDPDKYINFANVFSLDLTSKLSKYIGINNYAIKLVNINGFIRQFKLPINTPIFFNWKSDGSL